MDVHATNILNILKYFVEEILDFKIHGESSTTREESRTS